MRVSPMLTCDLILRCSCELAQVTFGKHVQELLTTKKPKVRNSSWDSRRLHSFPLLPSQLPLTSSQMVTLSSGNQLATSIWGVGWGKKAFFFKMKVFISKKVILPLYSVQVRPHMEYSVFSSGLFSTTERDIMERVQ